NLTGSTVALFTLNLTGGNNTSLNAGILNGTASPTLGGSFMVINNTNTTGTSTFANYQSNCTSGQGETVFFQGAGNTVITGGIQTSPNDVPESLNKSGSGTLTILGPS